MEQLYLLITMSTRPFWIQIPIYGGPSITLEIMGGFWNFFFFKHIRISPRIQCHLPQLILRSVEASRGTASLEVNISWKFNSQIWTKTFSGSPMGPWQYVVYHFSGHARLLNGPFRRGVTTFLVSGEYLVLILATLGEWRRRPAPRVRAAPVPAARSARCAPAPAPAPAEWKVSNKPISNGQGHRCLVKCYKYTNKAKF